MNSNEVFKKKHIDKKREKMRPKIILYNLKENIEDGEIIERLEKENQSLKESNLKLEFKSHRS